MSAEQLNLRYRPTSYWADEESPRSRIHRIKGEDRRDTAWSVLDRGEPDQLADPEFDQSLSDEIRDFRGRIHPSLMGGEYLPDFDEGEVEIARVALASVTGDVISIRARRDQGRVRYRIADEYETVFHFRPTESEGPLTLGELINLIDSVKGEGSYPDFGQGLTDVFRDAIDNGEPEELAQFVTVSSDFYPDLEPYYAAEGQAWLGDRLAATAEAEKD